MKRQLFAVFDRVSGEQFGPLMLLPNEAAARRAFQDAVLGGKTMLSEHPDDYALFYVADFDSETGELKQATEWPFRSSLALISAADVIRIVRAQQEAERSDEVTIDEAIAAAGSEVVV